MNPGIRTGRRARPAPLAAALAAAALALPAGAAAQDVLRAGREHGVEPPAVVREQVRREPTAYEFRRAWRQKTQRVREARLALEVRVGPRLSVSQLQGAAAAVTGTLRVPVLLGLYAGATAPYAQAQYQARLFGTPAPGAYSAKSFYQEMSRGAFALDGTVTPWLALPQGAAFYQPASGGSIFGNTRDYLRDALLAADPAVDFGRFDNDGPDGVPNSGDDDGYVDAAAFVYPTEGIECGGTGIWAHRWVYSAHWGAPFATNDARAGGGTIRVDDYLIQGGVACDGASLMEIGTFSHEMGHALGLPDLYDTYSADGQSEGVGHWDLMGSGNYNRPMSPAHMGAWSKDFLGWVNVETVAATRAGYTLPPVYLNGTVLRYDIPATREYFLLEHRAATGSDQHVYGPGLLVYHVDPVVVDSTRSGNRVNAHPRQGVDLEEADGRNDLGNGTNRGDAGDPFPGPSGRTSFGAAGPVFSTSNTGLASGLELRDIRLQGGVLSFTLAVEVPLATSVPSLALAAGEGRTAAAPVRVTAAGGAAVNVLASAGHPWLTVSPASAVTPADFTVTASAAGLAPGTYTSSVQFGNPGVTGSATVPVTFTVGAGIALGDSLRGELAAPAERDTVRLLLTAGDTVDVGAWAEGEAAFTPRVEILDDAGAQLAATRVFRSRARTGADAALIPTFVVPRTATYRLVVRDNAPPASYAAPRRYVVRTRRAGAVLVASIGTGLASYVPQGSPGAQVDTVRVSNVGKGTAPFTVAVKNGSSWVSVDPAGGTVTAVFPAPGAAAFAAPAGGDALVGPDGSLRVAPPSPGAAAAVPAGAPGDPVLVRVTSTVAALARGYHVDSLLVRLPDDVWNGIDRSPVAARLHDPAAVVLDSVTGAFPGFLAVAPNGDLVLSSSGSLLRLDPRTRAVTPWVSGLGGGLGGMEFGPDSALYVADEDGERVLRVSPAGQVTTLMSGGAATDVEVLPDGTIFAAVGGDLVRRAPGGAVSTLAHTTRARFALGIAYQAGWIYYTHGGRLRRVNAATGADEERGALPADSNDWLLNLHAGRSGRLYGTQNHIWGAVLVMDDAGNVLEKVWGPGQGYGLALADGVLYGAAIAPYPKALVWRMAVADAPAPRDVLAGDPSGDGQITAADALGVLSHVVGKPLPAGWKVDTAGDANCDGQVTAVDALVILSRVVLKDVSAFCIGSRR